MTNSIYTAKAEMLIRKPIAEVFEAFIDPAITSKFWFTKGSGKLEVGKEIDWTWEMYNLTVPVQVKEIKANETIIIDWGDHKDKSTVEWNFKSLSESRTFLSISNYGFQGSGEELIKTVTDSTEGFTLVVAGLKAWLEHGIELRLVEDKFPKEC